MPDDLARGLLRRAHLAPLVARLGKRGQPPAHSPKCVSMYGGRPGRGPTGTSVVGTDVAERRNLIMVNPAPGDAFHHPQTSRPTR